MRVFVAGASGTIGRSLLPQLVAAGHEVTGTTRSEHAPRRSAPPALGRRSATRSTARVSKAPLWKPPPRWWSTS
jgi:nucleoside-diphosphate-sugar epimerase